MSFLTQISIATNTDFINRIQQAAVKTALAVASEAPSGDSNLDQKRADLVLNVLNYPQKYARLMALAVATQDITENSTDAQIENTISAIWNAYAGV